MPSPTAAQSACQALDRPRLTSRIDELTKCALTSIVGPPGSGKSTLVRQWAAQGSPGQCLYLRLRPHHQIRGQCLAELLKLYSSQFPSPDLQPSLPPVGELGEACESLIAERLLVPQELPTSTRYLIFDGLEQLVDARDLAWFTFLIEEAPAWLRVVTCSRTTPKLPLARWRLQGLVGELTAPELALNDEEVGRWFGPTLGQASSEQSRRIAACRGWWAALQCLQKETPEPSSAASQPPMPWVNFIDEEVWQYWDDNDRSTICELHCLARFDESLAQSCCVSPAILTTIDRLNTEGWIERDGVASAQAPLGEFEFLPIMAEYIEHKSASLLKAERRRKIHLAAAKCRAEREHWPEAIEHARRAGDLELALDSLEALSRHALQINAWALLERGRTILAESVRATRPLLCLIESRVRIQRGDLDGFEHWAQRLENLTTQRPELKFCQSALALLRPLASLRRGQLDQTLAQCQALAEAGCPPGLPELGWRASLELWRGSVELARNSPEAARPALEAAQSAAARHGDPELALICDAYLVRCLRLTGDHDAAERMRARAEQRAHDHERQRSSEYALLLCEHGYTKLRGDTPNAALDLASRALRLLEYAGDRVMWSFALELQVICLRTLGEHIEAARILKEGLHELAGTDLGPVHQRIADLARLETIGPQWDHDPATAPTPVASSPEPATPRELEVLALIAEGLSNHEVAARLCVSLATVKTHIHRLLRKLSAKNRTEAVHRARSQGWI